ASTRRAWTRASTRTGRSSLWIGRTPPPGTRADRARGTVPPPPPPEGGGGGVPLERGAPARWDRELIGRGYRCLVRASQMEAVVASRYHLEAAIAARHCAARPLAQTDRGAICR